MVARLDFHIHTIPNSDKDSNFNFSKQWLIEYVSKAHLDAIAVTNHNLFDKDQYYEIVNCLGDDCIIYPGVELNVGDGHANIVFDNTVGNVNSLAEILNNLDLGINGSISIQEFESYFKDMDSGLIILEQGKSNSINFSEEFKDVFFSNYIFVYGVSNQFRFLRILNSDNKIVPVLFSDCHATNDKNDTRNEIKKLVEKNTFVQIDPQDLRFKDICQQLKDKTHVSINEKDLPNTFTVRIDDSSVKVSTNLNLVVGRRGSGKSYFLNKIREQYGDEKLLYIEQFHSASDAKKYIDDRRNDISENAMSTWYKKNNKGLTGVFNHFTAEVNDSYEEYFASVKKFANSSEKSHSRNIVNLFKEQNNHHENLENPKKSIEKLREVIDDDKLWSLFKDKKDKEENEQRKNLINIYNILQLVVKQETINDKLKKYVDEILRKVKAYIEKEIQVSAPKEFDIVNWFIYKKEQEYIQSFLEEILNTSDVVQEQVELLYDIHVERKNWESASDFKDNIPKQKNFTSLEMINYYKDIKYFEFVNELFKKRNNLVLSSGQDLARYLTHFTVNFKTKNGNNISGGQEVAIGLSMKLEEAKNYDLVLIDEPESSLDNVYISEELIPKLKELSKRSTVFVITHNSTLGTLINPDRLIVAKYDDEKNIHSILSGDFKSGFLKDSENKKIDSYDDFVDAMEAGITHYKEKGNVYESLKNQ